MEELAAHVLSEFYNCEVSICGKSHDGGIDLLMIESDSPCIIQVKRRLTPQKVETVSEIRQLLGVTLLEGSKSCMFVTTADHFSPMAKSTASLALTKNLVDKFELIDVHRFLEIFHLVTSSPQPYWASLISSRWNELIQIRKLNNH